VAEAIERLMEELGFWPSVGAFANRLDRLPPELLSRFTKLRFRDYTEEEFLEVAVKVLTSR
jgi:ATP-dependent Lon protease